MNSTLQVELSASRRGGRRGPTRRSARGRRLSLLCLLGLVVATRSLAAMPVSGRAINAENQLPLPKVRIVLVSQGLLPLGPAVPLKYSTLTGDDGRFSLPNVPAGEYGLLASAVGFGLIKEDLTLRGSQPVELEILLAAGTGLHTSVTVSAAPEAVWASLSSTELDKMKNVLMDDPLRALQQLPALVSSDDFQTGFAVQGSGFDHVGLLLDGIPVYSFVHTVEGVEDTGSTSLLSADLLSGVQLYAGGSSARWSGSSAGYLEMTTRSGNRSGFRNLVSVSGSALLFSSEGPLGHGSWIASVRKSYIDWIVRKIDPESNLNFGFHDLFGKVEQTLGRSHQVAASFFHGRTGLRDAEEGSSINGIDQGDFTSDLAHFEWSWLATESLSSSTHFSFQRQDSRNRNRRGEPLWDDDQSIWGLRNVWDWQARANVSFSAGITLEHWAVGNQRNLYDYAGARWYRLAGYDESTSRQQVFAEGTWDLHPRLRLNGGWTLSRQAFRGETYSSPFVGAEWKPSAQSRLHLSWGGGGQFPFFNQLFGLFGNERLRPERSRNVQGHWSFQATPTLLVEIAGYYRTRREVPWRPEGFWHTEDGIVSPPSLAPYSNLLRDRSTGGELRVGKHSPLGLEGWVGYAWGRSRWSEAPGEWFPGRYDQRHGLSFFLHYRWSSQVELSLKYKGASGLPIPAYAEWRDGRYYVTEQRNQARLPAYQRLDFRLGKAFTRDRYRATLFVEVLNLTGRKNVRFAGHDIDSVDPYSGRIYGLTQKLLPLIPTAGVVIEF